MSLFLHHFTIYWCHCMLHALHSYACTCVCVCVHVHTCMHLCTSLHRYSHASLNGRDTLWKMGL